MILPIVAYGDPVLKKVASDINSDYPLFRKVLDDMFETMYHAKGVGLAAPQVGLSIRLFIVDASPFAEDTDEKDLLKLKGYKKVFVNPRIVNEEGTEWSFEEGCLSIPKIREDVYRRPVVHLEYQDENFNSYKETFDGIVARIIQHEYDHIEGMLFVDRISMMRKQLLKSKLMNISKGKVNVDYKMRFPLIKR